MRKHLIGKFIIASSFIVLIPIILFIFNFGGQLISGKIEHWAQFGDYVGGVINTIISLLNLIVLIYITKWLKDVEDHRNSQNLRDLARPYPDFMFSKVETALEVKVKNCGLGPLVINDLYFTASDGKKITQVQDLVLNKGLVKKFLYSGLIDNHWAISKDVEETIFRVEFADWRSLISSGQILKQIDYLNSLSVTMHYKDIYGQDLGTLSCKVKFLKYQFSESD